MGKEDLLALWVVLTHQEEEVDDDLEEVVEWKYLMVKLLQIVIKENLDGLSIQQELLEKPLINII